LDHTGRTSFICTDDFVEEWESSISIHAGPVAYPRIFSGGGGFNKFSWGQRKERTGIWGR
jgi:hypothetical protein